MSTISRASGVRVALLLLTIALTSAGCRNDSGFIANTGLGYVFDLGNAEKITAWTLRQQDERKIADGLAAIKHIAVAHSSYGETERRSAANGYLQIYQRAIAGWPDIRPSHAPYWSSEPEEARRNLIRYVRGDATDLNEHHASDPVAHDLWARIVKLDPDVVKFAPPPPDPNGLFGPGRKAVGITGSKSQPVGPAK